MSGAAHHQQAKADRPFDEGLQPERTALAWQRTSLALGIGALAGLRVLPHYWGAPGLIPAGVGVAASVLLLAFAHRRYRTVHRRLTSGRYIRAGLPGGALHLLLAAVGFSAGAVALTFVLTS